MKTVLKKLSIMMIIVINLGIIFMPKVFADVADPGDYIIYDPIIIIAIIIVAITIIYVIRDEKKKKKEKNESVNSNNENKETSTDNRNLKND